MEVSRSGYYQYLKTDRNIKIDMDFELMSKVRQIKGETRGAYVSRRTSERLRSQGHDVSKAPTAQFALIDANMFIEVDTGGLLKT
jgi:hypothetical protein